MSDIAARPRSAALAPELNGRLAKPARIALLVFAGYYAGTRLGLLFTFPDSPISVLWPSNALLMAALLLLPYRSWPLALLAAFPAHLLAELPAGVPVPMVFCWFASNVAEALIGAAGIRLFAPEPFHLDRLRNVVIFVAFGAFLAPFLASFLDAGFVVLNGLATDYQQVWRNRFFANVLATLTVVPLVRAFAGVNLEAVRRIPARRWAEGAVLYLLLVAVSVAVFDVDAGGVGGMVLLYLPLPLLLWAALRFGPPGAAVSFATLAVLVIWGAVHGRGPFFAGSPVEHALSVQFFLTFVSPTLLVLAATLELRESTERLLRASEERFSKAFRSSPAAMSISRAADGALIDVNDRWTRLFGISRREVLGTNLFEHLHLDGESAQKIEDRLADGRAIRDLEIEAQNHAGDQVRAIVAMESVDMGGEACWVSTLRDITDQRRAELESREQRRELTHLSRVNLLGELSGALAHELNQPLTAILTNAEVAQRYLDRGPSAVEEVREILNEIAEADQRAARVIRRMRALLHKGENAFAPLDLEDVIGEAVEIAHSELITRSVKVELRLAGGLPTILGDRVQLQQLFLNLLSNACEAMKHVEPAGRILALTTDFPTERSVRAVVADRGPGVSPERLHAVFEPFVTSKEGGLGLGLSICRTIASAHGGWIWAENGAGGGAAIFVELPVHGGAATHLPESGEFLI